MIETLLPDCPTALSEPLDNWRRWMILLPDARPEHKDTCLSLEHLYAMNNSRFQWESKEPKIDCDWRSGERMDDLLKQLVDHQRLAICRRHLVQGWQVVTEDDIQGYIKRCLGKRLKDVGLSLDRGYNRLLVLM